MGNKCYIVGLITGFLLCVTLTYIGACSHVSKIDEVPNPTPGIKDVQDDLKKDAASLEEATNIIKKDATEGEKKTPAELKPVLNPHWLSILFQAGKQDAIVSDLRSKDQQLVKITGESEGLKKFAAQETIRANRAEASLADALTKKLYILVLLGVVGVAVGIGLMFTGYKGGMIVGIVSVALIITALAVSTAAKVMETITPFLVGGIILAAIGYGVWWFIQRKKEVKQLVSDNVKLQQVSMELVATAESAKQLMTEAGRKKMYGDGVLIGMAHVIQSKETQKTVENLRRKIKKAPPMPVKPTVDGTPMIPNNKDDDGDIWTAYVK
jgi:hypothetical protein